MIAKTKSKRKPRQERQETPQIIPRLIEPLHVPIPAAARCKAWINVGQLDNGRWVHSFEAVAETTGTDTVVGFDADPRGHETRHEAFDIACRDLFGLACDDDWPAAAREAISAFRTRQPWVATQARHERLVAGKKRNLSATPIVGDPSAWRDALGTATPAGIAAHDPDARHASREAEPELAPPNPPPRHADEQVPATLLVYFDQLARNRFNPRASFDEAELDDLAAKIARDGQLQAVLARIVPPALDLKAIAGDGVAKYEIVAGERRALAAQRAGLDNVRAEIVGDCDDARACALAIAENRDRKDISQVEYARGLERLAELRGWSPAQLAADQGISEQHTRNLLRLLKAPEDWQRRVIAGQIDGTHLRAATPFLRSAKLASELGKYLDKCAGDKPSVEEFEKTLVDLAWRETAELSRHVHTPGFVTSGKVELSEADPEWSGLEVCEIRGKRFSLNKPAAKKALDRLEREWQAKTAARDEKKRMRAGQKKPVSPEEAKRRAEAAEKKREDRLRGIVAAYKCWLCGQTIGDDPEALRDLLLSVSLGACALPGASYDALGDFFADRVRVSRYDLTTSNLFKLDDRHALARDVAAIAFWPADLLTDLAAKTYYLPRGLESEADAWIARLTIDVEAQWRGKDDDGRQRFLGPLTSLWLDIFDRDELAALAGEWNVPVLALDTPADLRRKLVGNAARIMPVPRALAKLIKRQSKSKSSTQRKAK